MTTPRVPLPRPFAATDPRADSHTAALEASVGAVEERLAELGQALMRLDPGAAESAATALHLALAAAMDQFGQVARHGGVPPALRRRLVRTGGQVAAQREAVARASQMLERSIDLLTPSTPRSLASPPTGGLPISLYSAQGQAQRASSSGLAQA